MKSVRVGLAGFGNIGSAVYDHWRRNADLLAERCGIRVVITAIAEKDLRRKRRVPLPRRLLVPGLEALVQGCRVDVVIELMGGCGVARHLVLAALRAGKPVVTANKALLAEHGPEIFAVAARQRVPVLFEASVAGGIPLIKSLREGLIANRFPLIYGIVNGTCNYILTRMAEDRMSFDEALRQAQELGYAEANPALDIDGVDSAHKAAVLAALAYNGCVDFRKIHVEGIRPVSAEDVEFARQLGYVIKLLAIIRPAGPSEVEVRVHPTLIPKHNRLASVRGVTNGVMVRGHVVGDIEFSGPGAGGNATASAVLSDVVDAARFCAAGRLDNPSVSIPWIRPHGLPVARMDAVVSRYYLRLRVADRPGVIAQISSILGRRQISIASVIQPEQGGDRSVPLIIMLHEARNDAMQCAIRQIQRLRCVKGRPVLLRVEAFGGD